MRSAHAASEDAEGVPHLGRVAEFTGYGHQSTEMLVSVYRASDKDKWIS